VGKGGKIIQHANQENELLQQSIYFALQNIDSLVEINNSLMDKIDELKVRKNKVDQEFVSLTIQHINELRISGPMSVHIWS